MARSVRTYGELVNGQKLNVPLDRSAKRKPVNQWNVSARHPRVDMAAMATGQFEFVHDVRVPACCTAPSCVRRRLAPRSWDVDESSVRSMPASSKWSSKRITSRRRREAVAGDSGATAQSDWDAGARFRATRVLRLHAEAAVARRYVVKSSDVDDDARESRDGPESALSASLSMQRSIGTSCAVADVQGNKATIWSPTQSAYPLGAARQWCSASRCDNVRGRLYSRLRLLWHQRRGHRVVRRGAAVAGVAKPVRVQLSRKDEMAWENYGLAYVIDQRIGLGTDNTIAVWDHEAWFPSRGGRPGYDRPGNVVSGMLAGFEPAPFTPRGAAEPAGEFRNGSNAAPSYISGRVAAKAGGAGIITSERASLTPSRRVLHRPLRSPSRLPKVRHEVSSDEVARTEGRPRGVPLRRVSDAR